MKAQIKHLLARFGLRVLREPSGIVMGHDLWRDVGLLLQDSSHPLCIDVGANHGEITAAMLALKPATDVHAFEPSAKCQILLRARFGSSSRVTLIASGLGDEEGAREFLSYTNDQLSSFLPLQTDSENPFAGEAEVAREQVRVTTLDLYAARANLGPIDLLKIDTQGFDLRVLRGAVGLLRNRQITHVLIELNFLKLYQGQANPPEIIAFLGQYGLHLVDFYEKCRQQQRLGWCTALFRKL
jgi:FkbM family methyltransferase